VVERGRTLAMGIESGESVVGATWQVGSTAVASTAESGWMVKGDGKAGGEAVARQVLEDLFGRAEVSAFVYT
jgi:hypothetical protein